MKYKFLSLLTILLGLAFSAQPALALPGDDYAILLAPTSQTINLSPGQEYHGKLTVMNDGELPFDFTMSAQPFQVDSESYQALFGTDTAFTQISRWITFPQESYHAEPAETIEVEFVINVPEDAVGGGQYAAMMARTESTLSEDPGIIQAIPQVASLLYARISGAEMNPGGELVEQTVPGFVMDHSLDISETVYNTGNVDFEVYHAVNITDFFSGKELFTADTKDSTGEIIGSHTALIFPGTSRSNTLTWDNAPSIGLIRVQQTVTFLDEEVITEHIVIFCPLWLIISIIVLIFLLILWIILAARSRKRKQPQVF